MDKLIKDIIDEYSEAVFDRKKIMQIIQFYNDFIHKNDDHISFFGGNLIGVYPVRFKDEDRSRWIEDICEIVDYESLKDDIHSVPDVVAKRAISGNPVNHLFAWAIHKCFNADLPEKHRMLGAGAALDMLQVKYFTGLDAHWFRYKADESVAQRVYEELSNKSLIKAHGNWKAVIEYRTEGLIGKKSVHMDMLKRMDNNKEVVDFVNDVQNRVRKSLINLYSLFKSLQEAEARILANKSFATIDGEATLREFSNNIEDQRRRMNEILHHRNDFIKPELIADTLSIVDRATETNLVKTLEFISQNIGGKKKYNLEEEVGGLVLYIYQFIRSANIDERNTPELMGKLRSGFRSHRTNNEKVIAIKDKVEDIVAGSISAKHEATRSATKVAVLVYISLRILSIPYYS